MGFWRILLYSCVTQEAIDFLYNMESLRFFIYPEIMIFCYIDHLDIKDNT